MRLDTQDRDQHVQATDRTEPSEISTWRAPVTIRYLIVKLLWGCLVPAWVVRTFSILFLAKVFSFFPLSGNQTPAEKRQVFLETWGLGVLQGKDI